MSTQQFQVVLLGMEEEGFALDQIREAMVREFSLSPEHVDTIVSRQPSVVMQRLDAETAIRYKYLIDAVGGISRIEPMPLDRNLPSMPGFIERRKLNRRQRAERRKSVRPVAYQSDRRLGSGRRASDR